MNANQLRASILQMAIEGKLVPQLDREPAVEQLGNAPEDVPFEIPEKWKWFFLSNVGRWKSGGTPDRSKKEYYDNGNIPWLKTGDLNDGFINSVDECITQLGLDNSSAHINPTGSVLIAMYGATIGKLGILNIPCATNQACCACVTEDKIIFNKFLFYYLLSQRRNLIALGAGSGQPNISKTKIINYLIALPPLEEQKRIVAKLEQLLPLVDEYGKAYEKLEELNAEFPDKLKASVLQRAIEGKLVPQLDSEPVASEYLKGLNPKVKFVDESETNYSIPDKWRIVKLSSICTKIVDGDHNPPKGELEPTKYLMLSAKNINNNSLIINDAVRFLSKENFETSHSRTQLAKDDVLLTIVGTLGRSCVVEDVSENITFQRSVACLSTLIYSKYLKYFLDAPDVQKYITINAKGTAQKGFYLNQLKNLHVAIPPLEEQKRIVAKVEELFALIDAMKK